MNIDRKCYVPLYFASLCIAQRTLLSCCIILQLFLLLISIEFSDRRQSRYDDRRRSDRSREPSRERCYDLYDYSDYYRAAYARGSFCFASLLMVFHHICMVVFL